MLIHNPFHILTLLLGVGNLKANGADEDEDEEPEEQADDRWMALLNGKDGVYSLKPLDEVKKLNPNVKIMGRAFRHIMRQAWGKCYLSINLHSLNPILVI
jgi:hypothetical protein